MNAKRYLNSIGNLEAVIKETDYTVVRIRNEIERIDNISVSSWGDGQPHGKKIGDPTGEKATKHGDLEEKRKELIKDLQGYEDDQIALRSELWSRRMDIIQTIEKVIDPEEPMTKVYYRILMARYCDMKSWEQIAVDIGYTYRHTVRLHGTALKRLEEVINE